MVVAVLCATGGMQCVQGTFRAHQVPASGAATNPAHLDALEDWRKSYKPAELFSDDGKLEKDFKRFCPPAELCMSRNPHTVGGLLLQLLKLPELGAYEWPVLQPGVSGEHHHFVQVAERCHQGESNKLPNHVSRLDDFQQDECSV